MTKEEYFQLTDEQLKQAWDGEKEVPYALTYLHTHTDLGSPKDAVLTVDQYVETAERMGAGSVSVSDHGTMYAVQPLYSRCKAKGIKLLVGCEFYVCSDNIKDKSLKHTRLHLVAYAKNKQGYKAISRLVTESNKRIIKVGDLAYPCVSKELLLKYIGEGSQGHGNVIGTTACMGGVVLGQAFSQQDDLKNLAAMEREVSEAETVLNSYKNAVDMVEQLSRDKEEATLISKKTYGKRRSSAARIKDEAEKAAVLEQIEKEAAETEEAGKKAAALTIRIRAYSKEVTGLAARVEKLSGSSKSDPDFLAKAESWLQNAKGRLQEKRSVMSGEGDLLESFEKELIWYDSLFGHGNWYAEMQYHGIQAEAEYMPKLAEMAIKHDIPVVAANDAHMKDRSYSQSRKVVNALRFKTAGKMWQPPRPDEDELYLKTDQELYRALKQILPEEVAFAAMKNRKMLTDQCSLEFEKEPHYPVYVA